VFFFLIKKAFFDGWDNLEILVIANFIFLIVCAALIWPVFALVKPTSSLFFILLAIISVFGIVLLGVISALMSTLADYRRVLWIDVPEIIKKTWAKSLILGAATVIFIIAAFLGITYYSSFKNLPGLVASVITFWIVVGAYLTVLWYFPALSRLQGNFGKLLKKCVLLMLDNFLLSLYLGFVVVPLFLIAWPITAFSAFGPSGIQLYLNCALRLLLYKYRWLEENTKTKRKRVPWNEILIEEKEKIGQRTIKSMIFPWK